MAANANKFIPEIVHLNFCNLICLKLLVVINILCFGQ